MQVIGMMLVEYPVGREMSNPLNHVAREGRTLKRWTRNPTSFGGNCGPLGRLWGAHFHEPTYVYWGRVDLLANR